MDIIAIYGYPAGRQPWINEMADAIDNSLPTIIMGDFNFVTNPIDRDSNAMTSYDKSLTTLFNPYIDGLELTDTFRLVNGDKIDFSYKVI